MTGSPAITKVYRSDEVYSHAGHDDIAPDLIVTSHHCVRAELNGTRPLGDLRFLFDCRWAGTRGALDGPLYEVCPGPGSPVIALGATGWDDHVVLRVRPVAGSRRAGPGIPVGVAVSAGEPVTAIGHPFGLPLCTAGVEPVEEVGEEIAGPGSNVISQADFGAVDAGSASDVVDMVEAAEGAPASDVFAEEFLHREATAEASPTRPTSTPCWPRRTSSTRGAPRAPREP